MNVLKIPKRYKSLGQALRLIYKQEGYKGYFKGFQASAILVPLNFAIYFDLYERFKLIVREVTGKSNSTICFAIPSVLSGLFTSLILSPFWVIH
jgi:solute carrier family 25 folate transporter 32